MFSLRFLLGCMAVLCAATAGATIFGTARGLVHDPQHRPIADAQVMIHAVDSDWKQGTRTAGNGEFQFDAVPVGEYEITASAPGFTERSERITVTSGSSPYLDFPLSLASVHQKVEVSETAELVNPDASSPSVVVSQEQIERMPGADDANSLAMITNTVPSAYIAHDQLHIRGGHQVSWLIDGVPVPNTNIASNVGPQFDPKDIDYLQVQRGGFSADIGDRTYGAFSVVTRSGFERDREGELILGYGSYNNTDNQLSFGDHSARFAWYASLTGHRTDLGLETPEPTVLHDLNSGLGGFLSLIFNKTPSDQLRLVSSLRGDHYQIPNTAEQQASGVRDTEKERDAFVNFSWVHTGSSGLMWTLSPFYHFNRAAYEGGPNDVPIPEQDLGSNYGGGEFTISKVRGKHNLRAGALGFVQRDNTLFGVTANDGSGDAFRQHEIFWGSLQAIFLEEQYKPVGWLTLNGGVRLTRFSGIVNEHATDPRIGAAIRIPHLGWVLRAFYGRYYQAPPLSTVSGPLLDFAASQGFGFLPLHGERDEQREFGLSIPLKGWAVDISNFRTGAKNYFDHDVLGNSNIFFPLTIDHARIRGWEATVKSPRLFNRAQFYLAYSHQYAEGSGGVTGGLTDFSPPDEGTYFLDHDQRNTFTAGMNTNLPWRTWASWNVAYGSGFLDGDGPDHLPSHTTFDLAIGKSFGERFSARFSTVNLFNERFLLDNSNTFGGTHFANPRMLAVQVRYRFHF